MIQVSGSRWLVWGFILALGLDVFLLGVLGARHLHAPDRDRGSDGGGRRDGSAMGRPFGGDPGLRSAIKKRLGALRGPQQNVLEARQQVRQALTAQPFDAHQLEQALDALRVQASSAQSAQHRELVGLASELTKEQREHLAASRWLLGKER